MRHVHCSASAQFLQLGFSCIFPGAVYCRVCVFIAALPCPGTAVSNVQLHSAGSCYIADQFAVSAFYGYVDSRVFSRMDPLDFTQAVRVRFQGNDTAIIGLEHFNAVTAADELYPASRPVTGYKIASDLSSIEGDASSIVCRDITTDCYAFTADASLVSPYFALHESAIEDYPAAGKRFRRFIFRGDIHFAVYGDYTVIFRLDSVFSSGCQVSGDIHCAVIRFDSMSIFHFDRYFFSRDGCCFPAVRHDAFRIGNNFQPSVRFYGDIFHGGDDGCRRRLLDMDTGRVFGEAVFIIIFLVDACFTVSVLTFFTSVNRFGHRIFYLAFRIDFLRFFYRSTAFRIRKLHIAKPFCGALRGQTFRNERAGIHVPFTGYIPGVYQFMGQAVQRLFHIFFGMDIQTASVSDYLYHCIFVFPLQSVLYNEVPADDPCWVGDVMFIKDFCMPLVVFHGNRFIFFLENDSCFFCRMTAGQVGYIAAFIVVRFKDKVFCLMGPCTAFLEVQVDIPLHVLRVHDTAPGRLVAAKAQVDDALFSPVCTGHDIAFDGKIFTGRVRSRFIHSGINRTIKRFQYMQPGRFISNNRQFPSSDTDFTVSTICLHTGSLQVQTDVADGYPAVFPTSHQAKSICSVQQFPRRGRITRFATGHFEWVEFIYMRSSFLIHMERPQTNITVLSLCQNRRRFRTVIAGSRFMTLDCQRIHLEIRIYGYMTVRFPYDAIYGLLLKSGHANGNFCVLPVDNPCICSFQSYNTCQRIGWHTIRQFLEITVAPSLCRFCIDFQSMACQVNHGRLICTIIYACIIKQDVIMIID